VDNDEAPVVQIDEGVAYDVWRRMASLFPWSASMIVSCRGGEILPEMEAASVFLDAVGPGDP
jgi:hypothetical protein